MSISGITQPEQTGQIGIGRICAMVEDARQTKHREIRGLIERGEPLPHLAKVIDDIAANILQALILEVEP